MIYIYTVCIVGIFNNGPNNNKDLDATISLLRLHDVGTSVSILGKPVSEVRMQKKNASLAEKKAPSTGQKWVGIRFLHISEGQVTLPPTIIEVENGLFPE